MHNHCHLLIEPLAGIPVATVRNYIVINPVETGLVVQAEDWLWRGRSAERRSLEGDNWKGGFGYGWGDFWRIRRSPVLSAILFQHLNSIYTKHPLGKGAFYQQQLHIHIFQIT